MHLINEIQLDFNDVLILPQRSVINSRKEVQIDRTFTFLHSGVTVDTYPVMAANMQTGSMEMAKRLSKHKMFTALNKYYSVESLVDFWKNPFLTDYTFYTLGLRKEDSDKFDEFKRKHGSAPKFVCIDAPSAYLQKFVDFLKGFREQNPTTTIMAGNVVTGNMTEELILAGADIVKVGIGSGCLGGGTRILMSNGLYKNIEDVNVNDWVINMHGIPVKVVAVKYSGIRKVVAYKSNHSHKITYVTDDHEHFVGDLSNVKSDLGNLSLVKYLEKKSRSNDKKFKWSNFQMFEDDFVCLIPRNIEFDIKDSFIINMEDYSLSRRGFNSKCTLTKEVNLSYELGYLIGAFVGDGNASLYKSERKDGKRNTCSNLRFYFGKNEMLIARKTCDALKKVFNYDATIEETINMNIVLCKSNSLARFFCSFYDEKIKCIPEFFICKNKNYLQGICDGMIDSDGSYLDDGRIGFNNTSEDLIEKFSLIFYLLNGYYPSMQIRKKSKGNLNTNIENHKTPYLVRSVKHPEFLQTEKYQVNRINSFEGYDIMIPTYDIEVDDVTHSFIANNCIVHNSQCLTRKLTSVGRPQVSAILECASAAHGLHGHVCSDGGIVDPGDVNIAFCCNSDFCMIGSMFAGTDECEGEIVVHEGKFHKKFFGLSSNSAIEYFGNKKESYRASEGRTTLIPCKGSVEDIVLELQGGTRSMLSYIGAKKLKEASKRATLIRVNRRLNDSLAAKTVGN